MRLNEFYMFVHGPFATNIHVDAQQVQKLKTAIARQPISQSEFRILKLVRGRPNQTMKSDQLLKKFKEKHVKVYDADIFSAID